MEGGEGPAIPTTSQNASNKDQSAVARGRGKSSNCQKGQKKYKRSRRSAHRRRHRRYRRAHRKISALKASQTRIRHHHRRRRARVPVRRYCVINLVHAMNDPETQGNTAAATTSQDTTINDQQAHPGGQANQDPAPSRELPR